MSWIVAVILSLLTAACASMGRPEGGPLDQTPPVYLRSNPAPGEVRFNKNRIEIYFDENVQLDNPQTKVVVSPAQRLNPQIIAGGKRVTVELRDSLIPNTTYTIDFGDAIADLNEKNPLDGFALDFATGDSIDSLRVSGMIFQARNLEPAQQMLVGVYSNLADSAISTLKLERIARTNQLGQFTIRGMKPGQYRIFAINDLNHDYKWDRSEDVAFYDFIIEPSAENIVVTDTLLASDGTDSITTRPGVRYLPNDILLSWFNENYTPQYLGDYKRTDYTRIALNFAAPADTLPILTIINGKNAGKRIDHTNSILSTSLKLDSLDFSITDPDIYTQDSMLIETRYKRTDSLDNLTWRTDTLRFNYLRRTKKKEKKKNDDDTIQPALLLDFKLLNASPQDLNKGLRFQVSQPLDSIDPAGIHLEIKQDTLWVPVKSPVLRQDTLYSPLRYKADYLWQPGARYRLTVDSLAVKGIYGYHNASLQKEFDVKTYEDYSTLTFNIADSTGTVVVELLGSNDNPLMTLPVVNGSVTFDFLNPGSYYARAFYDTNRNGEWDTGNIAEKRQPEEIFYYPKRIELKKNWDIEQSWNPVELPIDLQKPYELLKNRPKNNSNKPPEEENNEEEDEWGSGYVPGSQYNNNHNNNYNRNTKGSARNSALSR
ncbi:MAG: Ig-like domain-containing protein [Muribaculaceae bacterium]|nr:Ig-like domain-containing protein [Muribaculaceae bacterium]